MTPDELKAWRARMAWSQAKAADELGVTPATYRSWERGAAWATGKPIEIERRTALACAAIEAGINVA